MTILLFFAAAGVADAHVLPGGRTIVAQTECRAVAVLATYRVPSGSRGDLLGALVRWSRPHRRQSFAEAAMALRAIGGVRVELDGRAAAWDDLAIKLVEDPPGSGRAVAVVLATVAVPDGVRAARLVFDDGGEPTQARWIDRSSGRVEDAGPVPAGETLDGSVTFEWSWRERCESR